MLISFAGVRTGKDYESDDDEEGPPEQQQEVADTALQVFRLHTGMGCMWSLQLRNIVSVQETRGACTVRSALNAVRGVLTQMQFMRSPGVLLRRAW